LVITLGLFLIAMNISAAEWKDDLESNRLRPVPEGDIIIQTLVRFDPVQNFQFAVLLIFQDFNNLLTLGTAIPSVEDIYSYEVLLSGSYPYNEPGLDMKVMYYYNC
jgi:hypothetical protein